MIIKHSPPGWDDHPIESDLQDYMFHYMEYKFDPVKLSEFLTVLHSKNIISDAELLDVIDAEPGVEIVK